MGWRRCSARRSNVPEPNQWRPTMQVLSAPDPEEETRTVVRRVLADMEAGVPLWRMAILYTSDEPYAALVRETLDSAGVPWHAALGRPAAAGLAARSLLALLGLRERNFAREAVLDWIAARPAAARHRRRSAAGRSRQRLGSPVAARAGAPGRRPVDRAFRTTDHHAGDRGAAAAGLARRSPGARVPGGRPAPCARPRTRARDPRGNPAAGSRHPPARPKPRPGTSLVDVGRGVAPRLRQRRPELARAERAAAEALDAALDSLRQASALEPVDDAGRVRRCACVRARGAPTGRGSRRASVCSWRRSARAPARHSSGPSSWAWSRDRSRAGQVPTRSLPAASSTRTRSGGRSASAPTSGGHS